MYRTQVLSGNAVGAKRQLCAPWCDSRRLEQIAGAFCSLLSRCPEVRRTFQAQVQQPGDRTPDVVLASSLRVSPIAQREPAADLLDALCSKFVPGRIAGTAGEANISAGSRYPAEQLDSRSEQTSSGPGNSSELGDQRVGQPIVSVYRISHIATGRDVKTGRAERVGAILSSAIVSLVDDVVSGRPVFELGPYLEGPFWIGSGRSAQVQWRPRLDVKTQRELVLGVMLDQPIVWAEVAFERQIQVPALKFGWESLV